MSKGKGSDGPYDVFCGRCGLLASPARLEGAFAEVARHYRDKSCLSVSKTVKIARPDGAYWIVAEGLADNGTGGQGRL